MFTRSSSSRQSKSSGRHGHSRSNDGHSRGGRIRDLVGYGGRGLGGRNGEGMGWGREGLAMIEESPLLRRRQDPMRDISQGLGGMRLGGLSGIGDDHAGIEFGNRGFESGGLGRLGGSRAALNRGLRSGLGGLGGLSDITDTAGRRGGMTNLRGMTDLGGISGMSGIGGTGNIQQEVIDPRLLYDQEQDYDVNDLVDQQSGLPLVYGDPREIYGHEMGGPGMEGYPVPMGGGPGMMAGGSRGSPAGDLRCGISVGRRENLLRDPRLGLDRAGLQGPGSPHLQPGPFNGGLHSPLRSPLRSPFRSPQSSSRDGPQQMPPHQHPSMNYRPPYVEEYEGLSEQDIQDIMSMQGGDHHFWGPEYGDASGYDGHGTPEQGGYLGFRRMGFMNGHHQEQNHGHG